MKINDILNEHGLVPMYSTMKAYGMRKKTTNGQKHFVTDDTKCSKVGASNWENSKK
jgi:hypothetical protein